MSNLTKGVAVIAVILAIGAGLVFWKVKVGGHGSENLTRLTKEDMTALLADANPMQLQQLSTNPDAKKKIAENIRQLLAVASQARKDGLADDENVKLELESTRSIVTASLYDKKSTKIKVRCRRSVLLPKIRFRNIGAENYARRREEAI